MMADKGEWWSCGKCGDRYIEKTFRSRPTGIVNVEFSGSASITQG